MKIWNDFVKPIVVLGTICLISSVLLAMTNGVTAPIIETNSARVANETRKSLLPQADTFTKVETSVAGVTEMYKAGNGTGYVVTASSKGYGGQVPVMVSFDTNGKIVAAKFLDNSETPGLGQKVKSAAFQKQFSGMAAEQFTLSDIDAISGATISSSAAVRAINAAITAYTTATGGAKSDLTPEQLRAQLLPNAGTITKVNVTADGVTEAYKGEKYGVVIYAQGPGFYKKTITVAVGLDDKGVITGMWIDGSNETDGVGSQIGTDKFTQQFVGKTDTSGADAVAGATISSNAAFAVIQKALAAFSAVKGA